MGVYLSILLQKNEIYSVEDRINGEIKMEFPTHIVVVGGFVTNERDKVLLEFVVNI